MARLKVESLRGQAVAAIRAHIMTGKLVPGTLYSVSDLTEEFGASATPVREALLDVAHEGLVEIRRNRGFVVAVLSEHDLDEVFEIRMMLETPALARLAGRITEEELSRARRFAEDAARSANDEDLVGFLAADRQFHLSLVGALGNHRLVDIVGRLRDQTRLYGLPRLAALRGLSGSVTEHFALLDGLAAGDRARIRIIMGRHLGHTRGIWASGNGDLAEDELDGPATVGGADWVADQGIE